MTNITPTLKLKQINKNQTSSSVILKKQLAVRNGYKN